MRALVSATMAFSDCALGILSEKYVFSLGSYRTGFVLSSASDVSIQPVSHTSAPLQNWSRQLMKTDKPISWSTSASLTSSCCLIRISKSAAARLRSAGVNAAAYPITAASRSLRTSLVANQTPVDQPVDADKAMGNVEGTRVFQLQSQPEHGQTAVPGADGWRGCTACDVFLQVLFNPTEFTVDFFRVLMFCVASKRITSLRAAACSWCSAR